MQYTVEYQSNIADISDNNIYDAPNITNSNNRPPPNLLALQHSRHCFKQSFIFC